ncbi:MAG: helix-turn-helix domain-containing protein [Anaerolineales bacterium]|nr:helix-turn-helix domain-containing protein [Anaerolineales bacterium]
MPRQEGGSNSDRYHIRSVERALSILELFVDGEREQSASTISKALNLHRSTTFRFLATLTSSGFIEHNAENGKYRLGVASLELGTAFLRHSDLRENATSILEKLRDDSGETVHLAILEGNEIVYLEKLVGLHPIGLMPSLVGGRSPAHCTGLGKALLAFLSDQQIEGLYQSTEIKHYTGNTITDYQELLAELHEIRSKGFAVDNQEHHSGVMCVAAPVFDQNGVIAAMSVAGPAERIQRKMADKSLDVLVKNSAAAISSRMGGGR